MLDFALAAGILFAFVILIWSKVKNQTAKDTLIEIKEMFGVFNQK